MKEQHEKYKLPQGWLWVSIGELGIITSGGTPSTKEPMFWGDEIPWITPADLSGYKEKYISKGNRNISKIGLENSSALLLPKGSLLFSSRAPIGYIAISQDQLTTNQGFKNLIPVESTFIDYIYYYLQTESAKQDILSRASGTTFLELSAKSFSSIPIPLPPLKEQKRIVFKLEEILSGLEKSKDQLEFSLKQLNFYKQSILKKAYSGKLTEKKDIKDIDTSEKLRLLPKGWSYKELSKLVEYKPMRVKPTVESKLKFIGLDSIEPNTLFPSTIHNFSNYKSSAIYFSKDQELYGRMRPYLNKVWKADFEGACSGEFLVLECSDMILPDYLKYKLHSLDFAAFASERSSGDRPRVSFEKISDYQIPLCSIEEQAEIVRIIDHNFSNADKINSWVIESLEKVKVLEKIILKQAFEGRLTYQNPQGESTHMLLKNIKEEIDTYLSEEIIRKKSLPKSIIMINKLKPIIELLRESDAPVSSDKLWQNSDMKDDIDRFYAELKKYVEEGIIQETARKGKVSFLKLVDKNEN